MAIKRATDLENKYCFMNTTLILWLCSIASSIGSLLCILGVFSLAGSIFAFLVATLTQSDSDEQECRFQRIKKFTKSSIPISFLILLMGCMIPSTPQCYAIYGIGSTIEYIQNSEEAKKLPDNTIRALNSYLESITEENENDKE